MCFGRALEMEGEFQVGEKCIATEESEVMAIEMAKMTDAEICQVTQGGIIPHREIPNPARKWNPNPCFRCGLPGHKVVDCPTKDKDKPPEIGGKIHHFLEANTPVDRDLWAEFFNKCVKVQAVKKFRKVSEKVSRGCNYSTRNYNTCGNGCHFPRYNVTSYENNNQKGYICPTFG